MSDDSPQSRSTPHFAPSGAAAEALREALEVVMAHGQAVALITAEANRREQAREALIQAHNAREEAVHAEAKALMRGMPKRRTAEWSREERAQVMEALRAAAAVRLNLTLGTLPPVPAPARPLALPRPPLTPLQRRVLNAAQRQAKKVGQTLLPEGFQLVRPYNKKAPPVKVTKKKAAKARRRVVSELEAPIAVTVSPPGPWSISEDGLE